MVLNFFIVQAAPGGPVEQMIARLEGTAVGATERFSGSASGGETMQRQPSEGSGGSAYRGARGLPKELIQRIERMYGFDKPVGERFMLMLKNYLVFDFGEVSSATAGSSIWCSTRCRCRCRSACGPRCSIYFVSIPLGIRKAVRDGSRFDSWTSTDPRRAERHPGLPVRASADRAVRRRQLLQMVPLARPGVRRLEHFRLPAQGPGLFLAHGAADRGHDHRRIRRPHLPHQEFFPRGDRQAVRADRARQGPDRQSRALRPRLPQRHADRHRRHSGAPSSPCCSPARC